MECRSRGLAWPVTSRGVKTGASTPGRQHRVINTGTSTPGHQHWDVNTGTSTLGHRYDDAPSLAGSRRALSRSPWVVTTTDRVEITTPDGHTRGSGKEPHFSRGHRGCGEITARIATKVSPLGCRARQIEPEVPHCARHMTRAPARHHTPSPTHDTSTRPSPRTLPGLPPRHPSSPSPPRPGYRLPAARLWPLVSPISWSIGENETQP